MFIKNFTSWISRFVRKNRWSFRSKIIAPFFLLGLWLVIGGSFIVTKIVFENANERFDNQLIEGGKIATEWMVKEETNQLEALRFIAFTTGVAQAVQARDPEKLRDLTFTITLNKQLEAVEFIDLAGNLLFSMRHQPGTAMENYRFVRDGGAEFASLPFVQNALQAQNDQRGDKYAGLLQQDRETYFYTSGPIYDEQSKPVGALLVGLTLKTLISHLHDQTFARVTLYQPAGAPLSSSFGAESVPPITQATLILAEQQTKSVTRTNRILETDFVELVEPWKARGQDLGLLGVSYFKPVFINPSIPTLVGTFIFVFAVFLLIIAIGFAISNNVTMPLANLTRASQEVSRGNLQVQVQAPGMNDELTDLTLTFNHMVNSLNQANAHIMDTYDNTLVGWTMALELREKEIALHDQRVADMSAHLAGEFGIQGQDLINFRRGALLHDIGKMGVPDAILNKPTRLTVEEYEIIKKHPVYAQEILSKIEYLRPALDIPYCHHEKWDGTGYPRGLAGEQIPLAARIFAVVDVWDAITIDRVYRHAMTRSEALEIINQGRGVFFDPHIVDVFLKILPEIEQTASASSKPA